MTIPHGFIRCPQCMGNTLPNLEACRSCSGSGLVPTEELREEAIAAATEAFDQSEHRRFWSWPRAMIDATDAVLRKVAEHIKEER